MSIFTHTQVTLPDDAIFKISPSQIANFFDYPSSWYRQEVLNESGFTGNTASVLGTTIHYVAEQYALAIMNNQNPDGEAIRAVIEKDLTALDNPDVSKSEVRSLYRDMASTLINEYLSSNIPTEVESELTTQIANGIYVGGTCDNRTSDIVVDYKNVSTKPRTEKIPWNYYIQLMAYAYMYRSKGIGINRLRLVYTVRPTKTLPIRVFTVDHIITQSDWQAIEDVLTMIAETVLLSKEKPEYTHLLFKSMALKA